jgi:dTDP-4-dehydrorhamnose 3,5-epimerase-like enzyme
MSLTQPQAKLDMAEATALSPPPPQPAVNQRNNVSTGRTGCRLIELPRVSDPRGNLTFVEAQETIPYEIKRVYYLYDVPGGESRGGHAHRELEEFIIAASGSFEVLVNDGVHSERFFLNRSYYGLYIPRMVWRELDEFSSGSVCLVMSSRHYDESDYYRQYDEFLLDARAADRVA